MYYVYIYDRSDVRKYGEGAKVSLCRELTFTKYEKDAKAISTKINTEDKDHGAFMSKVGG